MVCTCKALALFALIFVDRRFAWLLSFLKDVTHCACNHLSFFGGTYVGEVGSRIGTALAASAWNLFLSLAAVDVDALEVLCVRKCASERTTCCSIRGMSAGTSRSPMGSVIRDRDIE